MFIQSKKGDFFKKILSFHGLLLRGATWVNLSTLPQLTHYHNVFPTWQRSSMRWCDSSRVVHSSEESQLGSICWGVLVLPLMPPPACSDGRAPVGCLGLLGGSQVVEVPAVGACAYGTIQAHGALARLLGLALARPHVQTWDQSQWWVSSTLRSEVALLLLLLINKSQIHAITVYCRPCTLL